MAAESGAFLITHVNCIPYTLKGQSHPKKYLLLISMQFAFFPTALAAIDRTFTVTTMFLTKFTIFPWEAYIFLRSDAQWNHVQLF